MATARSRHRTLWPWAPSPLPWCWRTSTATTYWTSRLPTLPTALSAGGSATGTEPSGPSSPGPPDRRRWHCSPRTFTHPVGAGAGGAHAATIDWGDRGPTRGADQVTFANGVFTVTGSHTYAPAGTYPISVVVPHDIAPDAAMVTTPANVVLGPTF